MPVEVETKDCTNLSDAELTDLADLCAAGPARFDIGVLSKARDAWVLVTMARIEGKLHGFSFTTLERIGGTPCVLIGLAHVKRTSQRNSVMKGLMTELYRRALSAFPDEDVVVGAKFADPSGLEAFKSLEEIIPRPDHRAVGEERAWGRRLVKRFGVEGTYDDQAFTVKGTGGVVGVFDHDSLKPEAVKPEVAALFKGLKPAKGDCLIVHGWAMAENLLKLGAP
ncbi:MAG: hypothetical protein AB7V43_11850 [Acidimicrobiia bacterium]